MGSAQNGQSSLNYTRSLRRGYKESIFNKKSTTKSPKHYGYKSQRDYIKDSTFKNADKLRIRKTLAQILTVILISIIAAILFFSLDLNPFRNTGMQSNNLINQSRSHTQESVDANIEATLYEMHVAYGENYLLKNDLMLAQIEFLDAMRLKPYDKGACLGLTKTLQNRCLQENLYCEKAEEYYTFSMKTLVLSDAEINELNILFGILN